MILADTSAWVEFDRGTGSAVHRRLADLIAADEDVAVTEPVAMELLAGPRTDDGATELRRLLFRFHWLPFDASTDFDAAMRIYRRCRRAGVTPRRFVDCMIAAVAWRTGATLLAQDQDLHRVAGVMGIKMDPASRG